MACHVINYYKSLEISIPRTRPGRPSATINPIYGVFALDERLAEGGLGQRLRLA